MRNVTISLDEEVARWARIKAAEQDKSLSRMVADMLREKMEHERSYQDAMQRFLSKKPRQLREGTEPYPRREDVHER